MAFAQRWREPGVTRRARSLALEHGYGLYESLTVARAQLRAETRTAALAQHVEELIRSRHRNPVLASIAATTLDVEAVAADLAAQADVAGWARLIGADLRPAPKAIAAQQLSDDEPEETIDAEDPDGAPPQHSGQTAAVAADALRMVPVKQADYDRWRAIWVDLAAQPDIASKDLAARHDTSVRTIQRVRAVGAAGLLDSPEPPIERLMRLAANNGYIHHDGQTAADTATAPAGLRHY